MSMLRTVFIWLTCAALFIPLPTRAESLALRMPAGSMSQHDFFYELLDTALREDGHHPYIEQINDFPHLRAWDMLEVGTFSVAWLVRSKERDAKYIPIPVNLTNGLIGKRILLVRPNDKDVLHNVSSIDEFRETGLIGGFGMGWFDVGVWKLNKLPYREVAKPKLIFDMLANGQRGVDYFSRGFNEVVQETEEHPNIVIEPHILLEYDRDFIFYVSPARPDLVPILTQALTKARDCGLIEHLIQKHWRENFEILKPESRTRIRVKTP